MDLIFQVIQTSTNWFKWRFGIETHVWDCKNAYPNKHFKVKTFRNLIQLK